MKLQTVLFLLPALLLLAVFLVFPVFESLALSFFSNDGGTLFVGFANYLKVFFDPAFVNPAALTQGPPFGALINNLVWIAIHLPLSLGLGLGLAVLMGRDKKLGPWRTMVFLGVVIPGVITGVVTQFLFDKSSGLVPNFFSIVGVEGLHISWFAHPETALLALILTHTWTWTGYCMVVFLSGLSAIPPSLVESAVIDGAGRWQVFRRIKLPLLAGSVRTVVVMSLIGELTNFDLVYSSTYGGPGGATNVVGLQMYLEAFRYNHFGTGSALASVLTLMAAVPIYFNVRRTVAAS